MQNVVRTPELTPGNISEARAEFIKSKHCSQVFLLVKTKGVIHVPLKVDGKVGDAKNWLIYVNQMVGESFWRLQSKHNKDFMN